MMSAESPKPIFIVGASRSGTAMIRSIIHNHPTVSIPGETHYFDDLRLRMKGRESTGLSEEDKRECEDYFLALSHRPYGHQGDPDMATVDRADLREMAAEIGDGADAYFEAYAKLLGRDRGAQRWGDKTPRHVFRLNEILTCFPNAQAICMVRDPRAVVASYRDWRNQGGFDLEKDPTHQDALDDEEKRARASYHPILATMLWKGTATASLEALKRFGPDRVRIQQYEKLVLNPEEQVREVADWLGLDFTDELLDIPIHNSSFSTFDKAGGVSTEPMKRWRKKLSPGEIAVVQSVAGGRMVEAGYDLEPVPKSPLKQLGTWASLPFSVVRATWANRNRAGRMPSYLWRRLRLVLKG